MRLSTAISRVILVVSMLPNRVVSSLTRYLGEEHHRALQQGSNDTFPSFEFDGCECSDVEFCGSDLSCHSLSCTEYFDYGPTAYTGRDDASSSTLDCTFIANPADEDRLFMGEGSICKERGLPMSLSHACLGRSCPSEASFVRFNRKCISQVSPNLGFACYDMSPETNFEDYYADYIAATSPLENASCPERPNETLSHIVNSVFSTQRFNETSYTIFSGRPGSSTPFNMTKATAAMYAWSFQTRDSPPFCSEGCLPSQFCGSDNQCHEYGCEDYFKYGPLENTNNTNGDAELSCEVFSVPSEQSCSLAAGSQTWPPALRYRCLPEYTWKPFGDKCDRPAIFTTMNRYCSASPTPTSTFECFDLDPNLADSYFDPYLAEVEANPSGVCDDYNETLPPPVLYVNSTHTTSLTHGELVPFHDIAVCSLVKTPRSSSENCVQGNGGNKWETLEVDRARHAMYATLTIDGDAPTTPAPTPPSSGSRRHSSRIVMLLGLATGLVWVG